MELRHHDESATMNFRSRDSYDMVIITSSSFRSTADSYASWRTSGGVNTKVVTLDDITGGTYTPAQGRDTQEKIKYFIKWAIENWGIVYVLLMGDADVIPVRYADVPDGFDDDGYTYHMDGRLTPSDLYYVDIYDSSNQFCSWDSNNNNVFGEYDYYNNQKIDYTDLYPDAAIGRITASTTYELQGIINKIQSYYSNAGGSWWDNVVLCGTDTFDSSQGDYSGVAEGEYMCDYIYSNYLSSMSATKCYVSNGQAKDTYITSAINSGARFVEFSDHGVYWGWGQSSATGNDVIYDTNDISGLSNSGKYPFVVVDACLTGGFDNEDSNNPYSSYDCYAELFLNLANAGAIGTFAASRVGFGDHGQNYGAHNSGYHTASMWYYYSQGKTRIGDMWYNAKVKYLNNIGINSVTDDKTIVEYTLFGDPSFSIEVQGVQLKAQQTSAHTVPGGTADISLTVENNGNSQLSVTLSAAASESGWTASVNPSSLTVSASGQQGVTLSVTAPSNALAGDNVEVTVTASDGSGNSASVKVTVICDTFIDMDISASQDTVNIDPGKEADFNIDVDYMGNTDDTLTLSITPPESGWTTKIFGQVGTTSTVSVSPFATTGFQVSVLPPATAEAGGHVFSIAVSSFQDPSVVKNAQVTVNIAEVHDISLEVFGGSYTDLKPGESGTIQLRIDNNGNVGENVAVGVEGPDTGDWDIVVNSQNVQVGAFDHEDTVVSFTVPEDALAGDYTFSFEATAGPISDSQDATVTVSPVYGFSCSLNKTGIEVLPDSETPLLLNISSSANDWDTIDVNTELPPGWSCSLKTSYDIDPFSSRDVTFSIMVPEGEAPGDYDVSISIASESDPSLEDYMTISVTVLQVHDVSVLVNGSDSPEITIPYGEKVDVPITLENRGNGPDTVDISIEGLEENFNTDLKEGRTQRELQPGEKATFTMSIEQAEGTLAGSYTGKVVVKFGDKTSEITLSLTVPVRRAAHVVSVMRNGEPLKDISLKGGSPQEVTVTLSNDGNAPAEMTVRLEGDMAGICSTPSSEVVHPGEQGEITFTLNPDNSDASGTLTIIPVVDGHSIPAGETDMSVEVEKSSSGLDNILGGGNPFSTDTSSSSASSKSSVTSYIIPLVAFLVVLAIVVLAVAILLRRKRKTEETPSQPQPPQATTGQQTLPPTQAQGQQGLPSAPAYAPGLPGTSQSQSQPPQAVQGQPTPVVGTPAVSPTPVYNAVAPQPAAGPVYDTPDRHGPVYEAVNSEPVYGKPAQAPIPSPGQQAPPPTQGQQMGLPGQAAPQQPAHPQPEGGPPNNGPEDLDSELESLFD